MNPVIVIPTFVSARRRKEGGSVLTTYDHATPISHARRASALAGVVAEGARRRSDHRAGGERAFDRESGCRKIQGVVSRYPSLNSVVIGAPELALIQQRMEQLGLGKLQKEIGLSGYGAVRNLGLVMADVLGFDSVVFLDDDEVVDDADFLQKAMYGLGKLTKKGIPILAKTGFYFNSEGSYLSKSQDKWYNHFWQQGKAFNKWITKAMRGPRLSRSNHVCGGCLALHKEAFRRLSFDPWIARGEDLDYMLNLRMYGSDIWFDNQWSLRHLPPETESEGTRFRQDIFRWLYEYRKMEYSRTQIDLLQVKPSSLEPLSGPVPRGRHHEAHSHDGVPAQPRAPRQEGVPQGGEGRHGRGYHLCAAQLLEVLRVPVRVAGAYGAHGKRPDPAYRAAPVVCSASDERERRRLFAHASRACPGTGYRPGRDQRDSPEHRRITRLTGVAWAAGETPAALRSGPETEPNAYLVKSSTVFDERHLHFGYT